MTAICYIGVELSARTQQWLLGLEIITLTIFAVVALVKVYAGTALPGSVHPQLSWFNPFDVSSTTALVDGVLLAVFIYWGWDSGVTVNEETENSGTAPGRAAIASTIVLVLIYVVVSTAAVAYAGPDLLSKHADDVFAPLGASVFGSTFLAKILILAVLSSASASTQTTILPTARTSLSMARVKAIPSVFGRIHSRYLSPSVSTLTMGALSIVWYVGLTLISPDNVLAASIAALGLMIAFYYGITGFACAIYFRHELFKSVKNFFFIGVLPVLGGIILFGLFYKSVHDLWIDNEYSTVFGVGLAAVVGIGALILGVILMIVWNVMRPEFFKTKLETADPKLLESGPAVDGLGA
jgi:amino acid transporter